MIILQQKPFAKLQPARISRCLITKILHCHCTDYAPNTLKDSMHKTESVVTSGRFWHIFTSYLHVNASLNNAPCSVLNVHLSFNWTFNLLPAKEFSLLMQILSHFPLTPPKKSLAGVFSLLETFNFFTFASPKSVGRVGIWAGHLKGRFFFLRKWRKIFFFQGCHMTS